MIRKHKLYILALISFIMCFNFTGCTIVEDLQKKLGLKNEDFEYLNSSNVEKISIQNTRDLGFKFIVTEPSAINDMYLLLSRAKISEKKSELEPDYKFEFDLGDEVKEFYYVVGSDEGNFYNENVVYSVSKRLDEGIMTNLSFIRKPRDFEYVYYNSILKVLEDFKKNNNIDNYKFGLNIKGDVECLKYIFSIDLKNFMESANKIVPSFDLINSNESDFDVVISVKNRGFDSTHFKTLITVNNKKENTSYDYYIIAENEFKEWSIKISEANPEKAPEGW